MDLVVVEDVWTGEIKQQLQPVCRCKDNLLALVINTVAIDDVDWVLEQAAVSAQQLDANPGIVKL